jgi:hypothetical protein
MGEKELLRVQGPERDPIALLDPRSSERVGEAARSVSPLTVRVCPIAVDDRDATCMHSTCPLEEADRSKRLPVRGAAIRAHVSKISLSSVQMTASGNSEAIIQAKLSWKRMT